MSQKDNILSQMFDVKPVDDAGDVDVEKIQSVEKTIFLKKEKKKDEQRNSLKVPTERLIEQRRVFSEQKGGTKIDRVLARGRKPQPKQKPLKQSDFKARAMQFNRRHFKKEHEIPHLIKSEYVPNSMLVSSADVVRRGELPERRRAMPKGVGSMRFEHSLESVLKQEKRPSKQDDGMIKTSPVKISVSRSPVSSGHHFEKKIDDASAKKFEVFFGGTANSVGKKQGLEEKKAVIEMAKKEVSEDADARRKFSKDFFAQKSEVEKRGKKSVFWSVKKTKKKKSEKKAISKTKAKKVGAFSFFSNYKEAMKSAGFGASVTRPAFNFAFAAIACVLILSAMMFVSYGFQIKDSVQVQGKQALGYLAMAQEDLKEQNFAGAKANFVNAGEQFGQAEKALDSLGGGLLDIFSKLPFFSKVSSGKNLVNAGDELALAAGEISEIAALFAELENPFEQDDGKSQTMLDLFFEVDQHIANSKQYLEEAGENIEKVEVEDLPVEYQDKFIKIKNGLPLMTAMIDKFEHNSEVYLELLGHNGPRKYLFLFQNNQEMRATGGFIGSYGLLHIKNGKIGSLIIDGIFNPDGQLYENIVPPRPIQKISAAWSTHDANWYPHFPTSAHKISWFYEKTGGPTVDGIITLTPTVMKKMLEITGEIEMPEYDTVVNAENFVEKTQFEVEIDFDKEENKPKKFIADLAPKVLNKLFSMRDPRDISKVLAVTSDALRERHILIYSFDEEVQSTLSNQGWSGEILGTERDFLMVVNSNINGYKTDGVIDETISHNAEIMSDGSIVDTVKIIRTHNGGDSDFEWWNKVNSNFMRVYVPRGSELISAKGHTREMIEPPLDYEKLRFEVHSDVLDQEQSMQIHEETGTRIYEEEDKTVFANWVYVSPKETVEVEYQYLLPFKIDLSRSGEGIDTYSLLAQKQSGSDGSKFVSSVEFDEKMDAVWKYPEVMDIKDDAISFSKDLTTDQFLGVVFQRREE